MENFNATMIIGSNRGSMHRFICVAEDCEGQEEDFFSPRYRSVGEAKQAGWLFTNDTQFCPPDEAVVAICPDCVERLKPNVNPCI